MEKKFFYALSDNFELSNLYLPDMDAVAEYIDGDTPNLTAEDKREIEYSIKLVEMTQDEFDNLPEYQF